MTSKEIRQIFLDFFKEKKHQIVASAPMVMKNDPSLMFVNAGMNQFKEVFLGHQPAPHKRVADSQKCLRVSGKHNDLEEVGRDTYHHTMFEMLGNWSFGDYFKEEAIAWAWELLTEKYGISKDRLYVTIFEGDIDDGLKPDEEAKKYWVQHIDEARILPGSKKDNFWEMGDTGPCGPCSEIHVDLRPEADRKKKSGALLVNRDHPLVIEIWNLVFIQFDRKSNGMLNALPEKHIDTGMGFERLCMALQDKTSNYDTDIFTPLIHTLEEMSGNTYGDRKDTDIAMRVIADHVRAVAFSIADGQLPSNVKAGYVIRRILRRAVRYGYSFLDFHSPFMYKMTDVLEKQMGEAYPELSAQKELISKLIKEEENTFFRTLEKGMGILNQFILRNKKKNYRIFSGVEVFQLYDTYGFPLDLTELIVGEQGMIVNREEFDKEMKAQKERGRKDANVDTGDWIVLMEDETEEFVGYDQTEAEVKITKYRKLKQKGADRYQLVFNYTPFYAESGGQVGDTGYIEAKGKKTRILDTKTEHQQTVHITKDLPADPTADFRAVVNVQKRRSAARNHTATHLMHEALRELLGTHVEQKGSLVHPDYLRFDFSHFEKLNNEKLREIENYVNARIRANIPVDEKRAIPMADAKKLGAIALFGEKYGDLVRVIRFEDSVELCGGTHAKATGELGFFHITAESAIAAGIRRIEAVTGEKAEAVIQSAFTDLQSLKGIMKNPKDILQAADKVMKEVNSLQKQVKRMEQKEVSHQVASLKDGAVKAGDYKIIAKKVEVANANMLKDLSFRFRSSADTIVALGAAIQGKTHISLMIPEAIGQKAELDAGKLIRQVATHIKGGGGGQAFFATAGGKDPGGLDEALKEIVAECKKLLDN